MSRTGYPGEEKRAYRYRITGFGGRRMEGIEVGEYLIDWKYFGKEHTWNIFNIKTGKVTIWWTGEYVDRGWKTAEGQYETDAERKAKAVA